MTATAEIPAIVEELCPGIYGNPYLGGHCPTPKQMVFLQAHRQLAGPDDVFEGLFGGQAGGGKSDGLLLGAGQTAFLCPGSHSVIIRLTSKDLSEPGAILHRALKWWLPAGVHFNGTHNIFTFPNGAEVKFAHHSGHPRDETHFQSAEYQYAALDELTHWKDDVAYEWVRSRLRRPAGSPIPKRLLSASNPGGPGHQWVKMRFIGDIDPETGVWQEPSHPYFPAALKDNPHIDQAYEKTLSEMTDPTRRAQLRDGDWDALNPGDYFSGADFGEVLDPELDAWDDLDYRACRWWDLAASKNKQNARTAGVLLARHRRGVYAVLHSIAFWKSPGDRDERIIQQAIADGSTVIQGLEVEPGSGGIAQAMAIERRLRMEGLRCIYKRPKSEMTTLEAKLIVANPRADVGKQARAIPVSSCVRRGAQRRGETEDRGGPWWGLDVDLPPHEQRDGVRIFRGPWVADFFQELEAFYTKGIRCDYVDAFAAAYAYLESKPFGLREPPKGDDSQSSYTQHDVHPSDRPETPGRDKGGRWKP